MASTHEEVGRRCSRAVGTSGEGRSALLRDPRKPEHYGMQLDVLTAFLVTAGLTVAIGLAIVAGKLSARLFFDASSRRHDEDEI